MGPNIPKCFNGLFDYGTSIKFDAENAISGNSTDLYRTNTIVSRHLQHSVRRSRRNGNHGASSTLSKQSGFSGTAVFDSYACAESIAGFPCRRRGETGFGHSDGQAPVTDVMSRLN